MHRVLDRSPFLARISEINAPAKACVHKAAFGPVIGPMALLR